MTQDFQLSDEYVVGPLLEALQNLFPAFEYEYPGFYTLPVFRGAHVFRVYFTPDANKIPVQINDNAGNVVHGEDISAQFFTGIPALDARLLVGIVTETARHILRDL